MKVCKLVDEHFEVNKKLSEIKKGINGNFDIEIKCRMFDKEQTNGPWNGGLYRTSDDIKPLKITY